MFKRKNRNDFAIEWQNHCVNRQALLSKYQTKVAQEPHRSKELIEEWRKESKVDFDNLMKKFDKVDWRL